MLKTNPRKTNKEVKIISLFPIRDFHIKMKQIRNIFSDSTCKPDKSHDLQGDLLQMITNSKPRNKKSTDADISPVFFKKK